MRWFLFFIAAAVLTSCGSKPGGQPGAIERTRDNNAVATEKKAVVPRSDKSRLGDFLAKNLSSSGIEFLNQQPLEQRRHAANKTGYQYDTFYNSTTKIIVISHTENTESQRIQIDGHVVSNYQWNGVDSMREVMIDVEAASFKHFSFYGSHFYYFEGGERNMNGGSAALITYYYLYDVNRKKLSVFSNFRVAGAFLIGDCNKDHRLDFFDVQNEGGLGMDTINEFTANIHTHQANGTFKVLADNNGKTYYLHGNTGVDYYVGDSMNIVDYYWPVPLQ